MKRLCLCGCKMEVLDPDEVYAPGHEPSKYYEE